MLSGVLICVHSKPQMKSIKWGEKQTIFKLMYLLPNMFQTPHYQVISIVICMPQEFLFNELHLHWTQTQWHEKQQSQSVNWGMERRKKPERIQKGRPCSLQSDGNKEQMENCDWDELTFSFLPFFSPFFMYFFIRSEDIRWPLYLWGSKSSCPRVCQRDWRVLHQDRESYWHWWGAKFSLYFKVWQTLLFIPAIFNQCKYIKMEMLWQFQ